MSAPDLMGTVKVPGFGHLDLVSADNLIGCFETGKFMHEVNPRNYTYPVEREIGAMQILGGTFGNAVLLHQAADLSIQQSVDFASEWDRVQGRPPFHHETTHGAEMGCRHLKCIYKSNPEEYGITSEEVDEGLEYFHYLAENVRTVQNSLYTENEPSGGVLIVDGDATVNPQTSERTLMHRYDRLRHIMDLRGLGYFAQNREVDVNMVRLLTASTDHFNLTIGKIALDQPIWNIVFKGPLIKVRPMGLVKRNDSI